LLHEKALSNECTIRRIEMRAAGIE
jgi:hypothetical protein